METQTKWQNAIKAVKHTTTASQGFNTLRDMSEEVCIDPASLSALKKLGEGIMMCKPSYKVFFLGAFASVDLCLWEGRSVAVKTLKSELLSSERDLHDFLSEAALLKKLSHPAIVKFVGVAIDINSENSTLTEHHSHVSLSRRAGLELGKLMRLKSAKSAKVEHPEKTKEEIQDPEADTAIPLEKLANKVMLVQEYMSQGTLKQMVTDQMGLPFKRLYSKEQGLEWLIQIAKGLRYLHNAKPKIIHRDLKLENIMLTFDVNGTIVAKIGDFGLHAILKDPKQLDKNGSLLESVDSLTLRNSVSQEECRSSIKASYELSGRTGSMMYMAPEVLHSKPYNEKADVFSFGIIMYEVLCKMLLLAFVSCRGLPEEVENYAHGIALGNRPIVPDDWPEPFSNLIRQCWAHNPEDRPTMDTIVSQLTDLRGNDWICTEGAARGCGCCTMQ